MHAEDHKEYLSRVSWEISAVVRELHPVSAELTRLAYHLYLPAALTSKGSYDPAIQQILRVKALLSGIDVYLASAVTK